MFADQQSQARSACNADDLRDTLFASDLKRLVRASQENDEETVSQLRELYMAE